MSRRLFYTIALFLFVSKLAASTPTTCMTVVEDLAYCLGYMLGSREVSPACCVGVKSLSEEAKTKENRQSICECATKLLAVYPYDAKRLTELPEKCGVKMAMPPIDKDYDCSK